MRVAQCCFRRYRLELARRIEGVSPSVRGHPAPATHREGVFVTVRDGSGWEGHGEIAPLPGLHREGLKEVFDALPGLRQAVMGTGWAQDESALFEQSDAVLGAMPPSVRCGVEMALLDLSGNCAVDGEVAVCGLVPAGADVCEEAVRLAREGYRAVKVKLGRRDMTDEIEAIQRIREAVWANPPTGSPHGGASLRLDANRAWRLEQAVEFARQIGPDGIEYIEEPVADPSDQRAFFQQTGIPIGLDETLVGLDPRQAPIAEGVGAVVLKPAALGGLSRTAHWIAAARECGVRAVLSSCFESSVAVRSYGVMALRMGLQETPQGLDTLKFLREDVTVDQPPIHRGRMVIGLLTLRQGALEPIDL